MLTRDEILARKTGRGKATLPDGSEVQLRAMTRDEVYEAEEVDTKQGRAARDNFIISLALIEPKLSCADVAAWGANGGAGDLTCILERVAELSGLKQGADKSSV